jgi:2,3-diketo-5-methylthiopentyl-1-phosphate enolase
MLSITDEVDQINEKARKAVEMGATGLLLAYSAGPSALRVLAEDPLVQAPILLHVSHMIHQLDRISFPVFSKICRLCGADMMLSPTIWSSIPVASAEECYRNGQVMLAPFYHIRQTWPMPAAGMYPGVAEAVVAEYGADIIIPAGGGMLGHPLGYKAGAMAWRQAIDAVVADTPLAEAAKDKPELLAALQKWGLRKRPMTRWGYSGRDYHPFFAEKNV